MKRRYVVGLTLVLLTCATSGMMVNQYGLGMFNWDDSEYLTQAVETFDTLTYRGYMTWPKLIATGQRYGKPPLYVNTLVATMTWVGRDRAFLAVALTAFATEVLLLAATFGFVALATNPQCGLLASVAVGGLPAVSRWALAAYPDVQLSALVVITLAFLTWHSAQKRWFFALGLGVILGLGMLSKSTFPAFVGVPLASWLFAATQSPLKMKERVKVLGITVIVALVVCSIWYMTNLGAALDYVRAAYGFFVGTEMPLWRRVFEWLRVLLISGIGPTVLCLAGFVLGTALLMGSRRHSEFPRAIHAAMLALCGGFPIVLMALATRTPPNTRHPLPSIVLFTLALLLCCSHVIWRLGRFRSVFLLTAFVLGLQLAVIRATEIPSLANAMSASRAAPLLSKIAPSLVQIRPIPQDSLFAVIEYAEKYRNSVTPTWYLIRRMHIGFTYGSYFTWSEAQCIETLRAASRSHSIVVVYESPISRLDPEVSYMNRHAEFVKRFLEDPANRFQLLGVQREGQISYYSADSALSK